MTRSMPPVAILGAGIAGLVAARELRRRGTPVVVYEAGKEVAGLSKTFRDREGYSYDLGAHFITNRLASAIGVADACRTVRYYGETVVLGDRRYDYPFGLLRSPRFLRDAIATRLPRREPLPPAQNAAEWFRREYGARLANEIAIPLVEAWSGAPATDLSTAVGEKLPGGVLNTLWLKAASRLTGRAVANGYCREQPESAQVWHVYPEGGVSMLCQHLARELGDAVRLESPVQAIMVDDERAVGVRVNGREHAASAVISTAPVHILARLVEGTSRVRHLARFRYRPMVFVNMRLNGTGLLPDVVTWTPESRYPFFRLTETTRSMPWLAPAGRTLVMADIGCNVGDAMWTMPDEQIGELCVEHVTPIIHDVRRRYLGCHVVRTPIAYPIFLNEYEVARRELELSTGVAGLYSIGRNGEFAHILMEDVYWRTLGRIQPLVREATRAGVSDAVVPTDGAGAVSRALDHVHGSS